MRKLNIIIPAILLMAVTISTGAYAQISPKFGVKAGLNLSTFNGDDTGDVSYKPGLVGGVFADIAIPMSPISIQPEILFAQYGAVDSDNSANKISLNYLQIPVLVKFGFPMPAANPNVFVGPYYGNLLSAKIHLDGFDDSIDAKDDYNKSDFGVVIGAGVDISMLRIGLRYSAGLTGLVKSDLLGPDDDNMKNGAFAITVGIAF